MCVNKRVVNNNRLQGNILNLLNTGLSLPCPFFVPVDYCRSLRCRTFTALTNKKIFIDKAVIAIFFFAFPTALLSFYRSISIGWQPQMYLHVALCITYTALFWKRKTLSYQTITVAIVSSCFAISFSSFLFMGLTGAGELFLVSA